MIGGPIEKLRDDAAGAMVSWDNSRIAFTNSRFSDIFIRDLSTQRDRRIFTAKAGVSITGLAWSPDHQHLAYIQRERSGHRDISINVIDLRSLASRTVVVKRGVTTVCWTRDGHLIYNVAEPAPNENSENLWELPVTDGGEPIGEPRALTHLYGFQFAFLRASGDGRRVSYIRWRQQSDVMTAQILAPGRIAAPRRLTEDERIDWPGAWTRDGSSILFYSDRNGQLDLFEQRAGQTSATPLLAGTTEKRYPQLSPDGQWILYLAWEPRPKEPSPGATGALMRVPAGGGVAQRVMDVTGYPGSARVVLDGYFGLTTSGHPRFRCPSKANAPCVLSEISGRQMVLTAFDPREGRLGVIARVNVDPANVSFWDLSADGSRLVVGERLEQAAPLTVLDLDGWAVRGRRTIFIRDWNLLESAAWSADAKGLYLIAFRSTGCPLLYATLDGHATVLYSGFMLEEPVVSPDGQSLAFGQVTADSNAWLLER